MKRDMPKFLIPILMLIIAVLLILGGFYIKYEDKDYSTATLPLPNSSSTISASTSTPAAKDSGITGHVTVGPTCPVERIPPDPDCKDQPYSTVFRLLKANGEFVRNFSSDSNGFFKVVVPPGEYKIENQSNNKFPRMGIIDRVVVKPHQFTEVNIQFDSGIR